MNQNNTLTTWMIRGVSLGVLFFCSMGSAHALALSYEQTVSVEGQEILSKVSLKDDQFRIESDAAGTNSVVISNSEGMYSIMPSENMAMKLPSDPSISQELRKNAENYLEFLEAQGAVQKGSEELGAYSCDIYEFAQPGSGSLTRVWVWKDHNFPVRVESEGTSIRMRNVKFNETLASNLFEVPAGLEIIDLQGIDLNALNQ